MHKIARLTVRNGKQKCSAVPSLASRHSSSSASSQASSSYTPTSRRPFPRPIKPIHELQKAAEQSGLPVPEPHYPSTWPLLHGLTREQTIRHNAALKSLMGAIQSLPSSPDPEKTWQAAFENGLHVILELGSIDQLGTGTLSGLQRVARLCASQARSEAGWPLQRALLLTLAERKIAYASARNSTLANVVADWAWNELAAQSPESAGRIIEVWKLLPPDITNIKGEGTSSRTLPPRFLAGVAAAHALLPKASLPSFLQDVVTRNILLERQEFHAIISKDPLIQQVLSALSKKARAWIDQTELAMTWCAQRGGAEGLRNRVKSWGNRKDVERLDRFWAALLYASDVRSHQNDAWLKIGWQDPDFELDESALDDEVAFRDQHQHRSSSRYEHNYSADDAAMQREMDAHLEDVPLANTILTEKLANATLQPDLVSAFLLAYFRADRIATVVKIWNTLLERDLKPTSSLWMTLIAGYSMKRDANGALQVMQQMKDSGVEPDAHMQSFLIQALFRSGDIEGALEQLQDLLKAADSDQIPSQAYNRVIHGLLKCDLIDRANDLMMHMPKEGNGKLTTVTVNTLLSYYAQPNSLNLSKLSEALKFINEQGLQPDVTTFNTIIQGLLVGGRRDAAERVLTAMERLNITPNERTYAPLIHDLVQRSDLQQAVRMLEKMESTGRPNEFVYTIVIKGFCDLPPMKASNNDFDDHVQPPNMAEAQHMVDRMKRKAIPLNSITYNSLIMGHVRTGNRAGLQRALKVFDELCENSKKRGVNVFTNTWYILLTALMDAGETRRAKKLVEEMGSQGFTPTDSLGRLVSRVKRA